MRKGCDCVSLAALGIAKQMDDGGYDTGATFLLKKGQKYFANANLPEAVGMGNGNHFKDFLFSSKNP